MSVLYCVLFVCLSMIEVLWLAKQVQSPVKDFGDAAAWVAHLVSYGPDFEPAVVHVISSPEKTLRETALCALCMRMRWKS